MLAELPSLVAEIVNGRISLNASRAPLADVEKTWTAEPSTDERIVLVPSL